MWPSASTIVSPMPSLPVFGTDSPPVATMTASASSGAAPRLAIVQSISLRATDPVTTVFITSSTPLRRASASSPSRTSRARSETGNSFALSASSFSGMPTSCSKKAICSSSGHERRILRSVCGDESVTKRDSSSRAGRMLQRPPPLIRILRPPSAVRSTSVVCAPLPAAKIAAIVPAAPAPMTTTRDISAVSLQLSAISLEVRATWRVSATATALPQELDGLFVVQRLHGASV